MDADRRDDDRRDDGGRDDGGRRQTGASVREGIIRNPVLPGSHPDPSILQVGDDHYVAASTFEWFPGVRLHHSTDPVDWRPLGGAHRRGCWT
ncbi:family 43 glycosylhydrolase [Kitasatospora terrestris]|uniref:Uncharacterized protein n=1 Tax=Kitasatospora terrestris TaxID=258051 RepID=A0ABP9EGI3_9ACTN